MRYIYALELLPSTMECTLLKDFLESTVRHAGPADQTAQRHALAPLLSEGLTLRCSELAHGSSRHAPSKPGCALYDSRASPAPVR